MHSSAESLPPTIIEEMEEMFLRLSLSQTVAIKLVDDQGIDSPWTLISLSSKDIATICDVTRMTGSLSTGKMPDRGNQTSVLAMKNLKLISLMFKTMKHCSKAFNVGCVNSTSLLHYQHHWELEQEKTDNAEAPKVDENN